MKTWIAMMLLSAGLMLPAAVLGEVTPAQGKKCDAKEQAKCEALAERQGASSESWTPIQICFFPGVPEAMWTSNVYGFKSGWPVTCGHGRVWGLEGSWFYSGTDNVRGIQVSWIVCKALEFDGIQSSWITCLNLGKQFNGLQASAGYVQSGDLNGAQCGTVNLAGNVQGLQAGLAFCLSKDVTGFQASPVAINRGTLRGVQCNFYGQVEDATGLQIGVVNVSRGGGFQFGLINVMKDGFLPFFPLFNFSI
ncbi:MAG: hypothetical protein PHS41_01860 [Victivallaceae bacterium]|nr:hypothetical protein [Victivallaceae bacterium]